MKLLEALRVANNPQEGPAFAALLVCGFTPLHLQTAVTAHLRLLLPRRTIVVRTGLYGDPAGTLEKDHGHLDAVMVALEWADLDPRLGWRSMGPVTDEVIADSRVRLERLAAGIERLAQTTAVSLALPLLPIAPVFHTPATELHCIEARLMEMLYKLAARMSATVVHPQAVLAPSRHDLRSELMTGFPYSFVQADSLAEFLVRAVLPLAPKKGLITDLDETLWSGILGDDGPEGISWDLDHKTQFHALYQHLLNTLAERGTLIGVTSKNDPELVKKAFARADLVVKPANLFPVEAHWRAKVESIQHTLQQWNIQPDSIVFVDDNALELEQVRVAFPTIECLKFRMDDSAFLSELNNRFAKRRVLEEDRLRAASLRKGQAVREAASDSAAIDTLLAGADAKLRVSWAKLPVDHRAFELVNKTNQFNLNGNRYTESDWVAFLANSATRLIVVEYEDRFGKLGKIAVLGGREQDGSFEVDIWVMSCRAFSRRIEYQCLKLLLDKWESVSFKFRATERNGPIQDFLAQAGAQTAKVTRARFERHCPRLFHRTECLHE